MVALANNNTWYVGSTKWTAVTAWASGTVYAAGVLRRQLATPTVGNERVFACIVGGTSGGSEPAWTVTKGAKTTDNTVTWQEVTGQCVVNGDITNAISWTATRTVTIGQMIYDSVSGALQIVTSISGTGTTASSTPTFSATAGTTTTDNAGANQVVWTSLGAHGNFGNWAAPHARLSNAFASTWGAAGDTFYVSNNHAATQSSALTLLFPGTAAAPNAVYCVDDTVSVPPATLATTATESTTGASALSVSGGFGFMYGTSLSSGDGSNAASLLLASGSSVSCALYFESCGMTIGNTSASSILGLNSTSSAGPKKIEFKNCALVFGATTQSMTPGTGRYDFIGGSIAATGSIPATLVNNIPGDGVEVLMRDVDLSALTGNLLIFSKPSQYRLTLANCKLNSSLTPTTGSSVSIAGGVLDIWNSDSSGTNYNYRFQDYLGTATPETSIVRTGGATDGTTPVSMKLVSTANAKYLQPFVSKELAIWQDVTGASKTASIEITTNSTLNNNDCWIEVEYLGTSGYPIASRATGRMTPLGTPTALTASSATWGGTAQTNKYTLSASFTPQMKGPLKVKVYLGKASATVYVDPLITIV